MVMFRFKTASDIIEISTEQFKGCGLDVGYWSMLIPVVTLKTFIRSTPL